MPAIRKPRRRSVCVATLTLSFAGVFLIGSGPVAGQPGDAVSRAGAERSLKQQARDSYHNADLEKAREHLTALVQLYRAQHAAKPSWRGRYQFSRRLVEVAHEYLRAGQLSDALEILGEAADLDVPLRNSFDNGFASAAGGLHRRLAALDSDQRCELLRKWSLPTASRATVRVFAALAPTQDPPPVFARALGERPRDSSFPVAHVGEVSGLFSSAWELARAADEAGQLRRLTAELEQFAREGVPNAEHVLTLARIVAANRPDDQVLADVTERLSRLRNGRPAGATERGGFDETWRYGYGTYDATTESVVNFKPLAVWTGAAWQMIPDRPHESFGYIRIDRTGGHPETAYACIRRWTAPGDGVVSVSGTLHHPTEEGDGILARVISSRLGQRADWTAHDGTCQTELESLEVKTGDTIDFLVEPRNSLTNDTFVWLVQLRHEASDGTTRLYDSADDFCGPSDDQMLSDTVLAAACLERKWLQPLGESIFSKLLENTYDADTWLNRPADSDSPLLRPALRRAWATAVLRRNGETDARLDGREPHRHRKRSLERLPRQAARRRTQLGLGTGATASAMSQRTTCTAALQAVIWRDLTVRAERITDWTGKIEQMPPQGNADE